MSIRNAKNRAVCVSWRYWSQWLMSSTGNSEIESENIRLCLCLTVVYLNQLHQVLHWVEGGFISETLHSYCTYSHMCCQSDKMNRNSATIHCKCTIFTILLKLLCQQFGDTIWKWCYNLLITSKYSNVEKVPILTTCRYNHENSSFCQWLLTLADLLTPTT